MTVVLPNNIADTGPTNTWPSAQGGYGTSGVPYYDLLNQFLEYLSANPDSLSAKLNFVEYVGTLNQGGVLSSSAVESLLEAAGLITVTTTNGTTTYTMSPEFETIIQEGTLASMFNGYTAKTGDTSAQISAQTNGQDTTDTIAIGATYTGALGALAFLNDLSNLFSNSGLSLNTITTAVNSANTASADATAVVNTANTGITTGAYTISLAQFAGFSAIDSNSQGFGTSQVQSAEAAPATATRAAAVSAQAAALTAQTNAQTVVTDAQAAYNANPSAANQSILTAANAALAAAEQTLTDAQTLVSEAGTLVTDITTASLNSGSQYKAAVTEAGVVLAQVNKVASDASTAATDATAVESIYASAFNVTVVMGIQEAIAQIQGQVSAPGGLAATYGFSTSGNGATGAGTVSYTNLDGTVSTYSYSNASDKAFIENYIANITTTGAPDTFFSSMDANTVEKEYRVTAVNNLVASYPTDPSIVLCLFMGMMADNLTQIQLSGLANTSNILNNMANTYTTPLLQVVQSINGTGSITSTQAEQFVTLLYTATDLINTTPQLSSIASAWNANVFNTIGNISVTFSNTYGQTVKTTLGNVMSGGPDTNGGADPGQAPYSSTDVAAALQSLQQLDNANSTAGTNAAPGYQAILDAVQQGGSLVTNQSQTISTQVGTLTQNDAQYLAFLSMISSSTGGGFAQLMLYLCSSTQQTAQ